MEKLVCLRLISLLSVILLSIPVVGLSGYVYTQSPLEPEWTLPFGPVSFLAFALTWVTLVPMMLIDRVRVGAFSSLIGVEIGVLVFLSIVYFVTAIIGLDEQGKLLIWVCGTGRWPSCGVLPAMIGLSFMIWMISTIYICTLLALCTLASLHGRPGIWRTMSLKQAVSAKVIGVDHFDISQNDVHTQPTIQPQPPPPGSAAIQPQPLPPGAPAMIQPQPLPPGSDIAIQPQPLPPGGPTMTQPQPLPPGAAFQSQPLPPGSSATIQPQPLPPGISLQHPPVVPGVGPPLDGPFSSPMQAQPLFAIGETSLAAQAPA